MHFRRTVTGPLPLERLLWAPFLSILFILCLLLMVSSFTTLNEAPIKYPKALTSDIIRDEHAIISVSGEQVIYFNNRGVTMKELRQLLARPTQGPRRVLVKADRHSSIGRIVDIWNLCRELGIEDINLATSREK